MTLTRSPEYLRSLLQELASLPKEAEWLEFTHNNFKPVGPEV